jgi:hypothetical protein
MDRKCDTANDAEESMLAFYKDSAEGKRGARVTMTNINSRKETRRNRWKCGVNGLFSATVTMRKK